MKNEISVLITDDNIEFGDILNEYLSQSEDMKVVGIARDGLQALEKIKELKPDVVILDVIMPNLDGIGVLEKISAMDNIRKPIFVMLSAIGQDIFIQQAMSLGAEYYIVKPFNVEVLISRIRQLYKENCVSSFHESRSIIKKAPSTVLKQQENSHDVEVQVTYMMRDIGIPPHMSGYQYIREAIVQTINNSKVFGSITKVLYPAVAQKFNTTPQKVERAIRNAIESAWSRGNPDSIDTLFGYTINYSKGKPTNSEFIAMIADKVRINMNLHKS
ncbi:MAG: sporulation transcription factor Spo0A [Bacillota bacterium]|nr:sporulation transcription factor Spo0A [Bacillota bacterium]